jgi:hypothetical protein
MAGRSKIQDEQEVLRWFEEGRTYKWMVETYLEKYNIETTIAMWGNFRRRMGLDQRIAWDDQLIPWAIKPEHRTDWPLAMLRREARRRAGFPLSEEHERELNAWIAARKRDDEVVHYEPDTAEGWFYLPRRPGIDKDLIREPQRATGKRRG